MGAPRTGSSSRNRWALGVALAAGSLVPTVGCQVEYGGMTLPSGKYMHDDVQYFAPGPDFPWANTQAATQRARMQAMGMELPPPGTGVPGALVPKGAESALQTQGGRIQDVNQNPNPMLAPGDVGAPAIPAPGPGAVAPAVPPPPPPDGAAAPDMK